MENTLIKYIAAIIERTKANHITWAKKSVSTYHADMTKDSRLARLIIQRIESPEIGAHQSEYQFRVWDMSSRTKVIDLSSAERPELRGALNALFKAIKDGEDLRGVDFLKDVLG